MASEAQQAPSEARFIADDWALALEQALEEGRLADARAMLDRLYPAQLADVLEALPEEPRLSLWALVPATDKGEVFTELGAGVRDRLLQATSDAELMAAVAGLQLDELADLYPRLPPRVMDAVLAAMDAQRRERFDRVLSYPPDSAGGLMDTDAIAVRADANLGTVLRYLRKVRAHEGRLPEHTDMLAVVDRDNLYLGALHLSDLVSVEPSRTVSDAMTAETTGIPADTSAARVARLFEDRDLLSAAVVDDKGCLIGRITVDDVLDVIREETERSIRSRAGLDKAEDMFAPLLLSARRRGVWLAVNLVQAFTASYVIGLFDATIRQQVALAILMPIIASMGSVAGIQTLTMTTRGLAMEQVGRANARRLLLHELGIGGLNGVLWALVMASIVVLWFGNVELGIVFAAALLFNFFNAAFSGTVIPLLLSRWGIDPAVAGGVALTAATDILGFFSFLGLATLVLL